MYENHSQSCDGYLPLFVIIYYILQLGRTPLHVASQANYEEYAEALIKAGANVNIVSYYQTS